MLYPKICSYSDSNHLAKQLESENSTYINQLGVKSKFPPLNKAIKTPKARLKKIEVIKRRSENNSPPDNGRLTPIDLENCTGFIFVK